MKVGFGLVGLGANHWRSWRILDGRRTCGHGLASRPRETSSVAFLSELLVLIRYPPNSAGALLDGVLPLRNCAARFACKVPIWRLPPRGTIADLLAEGGEVGIVQAPCIDVGTGVRAGAFPVHDGSGVDWARGAWGEERGGVGKGSD